MSDPPLGLSTGCFHGLDILRALELIREGGFPTVEIWSSPGHFNYRDPQAVSRTAEKVKELGLEPLSFHAPFAEDIDITNLDQTTRTHSKEEVKRAANAAAGLSTSFFVLHPGPEREDIPAAEHGRRLRNAVESIQSIAETCAEGGVKPALENMLPHLYTGGIDTLLQILSELDVPGIGACLDTGHAHLAGRLPSAVGELKKHLSLLHLNDNNGEYDDHLAPGDGKISWRPFFTKLAEEGFAGRMILEIGQAEDHGGTIEKARRGRRFIEKALSSVEPGR